MKNSIPVIAISLLLAGCGLKTPVPVPAPAGYADGTKTVGTSNLIFTATSKGVTFDSLGGMAPANVTISYRTTSDPNVIFAIVNGQEIQLDWDASTLGYFGSNASYDVSAGPIQTSVDQQVTLGIGSIGDLSPTGAYQIGFYTTGLETDPASITATTRGGAATYTGATDIGVIHEDPVLGTSGYGYGSGTGTLSANFATGTVSGSMSFTDGMTFGGVFTPSDPGYGLSSPTTININPTTISGNGFSSTLAITPADLSMTSVTSSSISGTFYGVNAADVGATFNGSGVSWDGTTPVTFIGGFLGQ